MTNTDLVLGDGSSVRVTDQQLDMWDKDESAVRSHIEHVRVMNEEVSRAVSALFEMTAVGVTGYRYGPKAGNANRCGPSYYASAAELTSGLLAKAPLVDCELSAMREWLTNSND